MNLRYRVIGLMSGTSLDGLDVVCSSFQCVNNVWTFKILNSKTYKYDFYLIQKIQKAYNLNVSELRPISIELANTWANFIKDFLLSCESKVDFIASHGHTVIHQPEKGVTLQIGDPQMMANILNRTIISDFRSKDVLLGGQGAPLVPIGDMMLFSEYGCCVNLGGISNISFNNELNNRVAFDISPCNLLFNYYSQKIGFDYDEYGRFAKDGNLSEELYDELNKIEYYIKPFPKSLGRENVEMDFIPVIEKFNLNPNDVLRTLVEHVAYQISIMLKGETALFSGGGVYNTFLMERIQELSLIEIVIPNKEIIEYKEALIFAFLGVLKMRNETNVLSSVTGASKDTCSGVITFPEN